MFPGINRRQQRNMNSLDSRALRSVSPKTDPRTEQGFAYNFGGSCSQKTLVKELKQQPRSEKDSS